MPISIFPVIGHFKGGGKRLRKKIEEFKPEIIIFRLDPEEEISGSPILDILKKFGMYEKSYSEWEALKGKKVLKVEINEEELIEKIPKKFSVLDVIRYNLFLKRLSSDWESWEEFLNWWEKAALQIKHIRSCSEAFSEKILRIIEKNKGKRILVVADYLTSRVLEEVLRSRLFPYEFEDYLLSPRIDSTEKNVS